MLFLIPFGQVSESGARQSVLLTLAIGLQCTQRSTLTPILFNTYMELLGLNSLRDLGFSVFTMLMTYCSVVLSSDIMMVVENLNQCLEAVIGWIRALKQKLNSDKMEVQLIRFNLTLGNDIILMLYGIALPLTAHVCSWENLPGSGAAPGCPGSDVGQMCLLPAAASMLNVTLLRKKDRAIVTHALIIFRLNFF